MGYNQCKGIQKESDFDEILEQIHALNVVSEAKTRELTAAIKTQVATGDCERSNEKEGGE